MFCVQRRERDGVSGQYLGFLIMFSPPTPLFTRLRVA